MSHSTACGKNMQEMHGVSRWWQTHANWIAKRHSKFILDTLPRARKVWKREHLVSSIFLKCWSRDKVDGEIMINDKTYFVNICNSLSSLHCVFILSLFSWKDTRSFKLHFEGPDCDQIEMGIAHVNININISIQERDCQTGFYEFVSYLHIEGSRSRRYKLYRCFFNPAFSESTKRVKESN